MTPRTLGLASLERGTNVLPNHFRLRRRSKCTVLIGSNLLRPFLAEKGIYRYAQLCLLIAASNSNHNPLPEPQMGTFSRSGTTKLRRLDHKHHSNQVPVNKCGRNRAVLLRPLECYQTEQLSDALSRQVFIYLAASGATED
jgi:hypothetical protein